MILRQVHRTYSNMGMLQYFGAFLLCLMVVAAQTSETLNQNEIESNPKGVGDISINEKDNEKAASAVSVVVKEIKLKEKKDKLEALSSTTAQKREKTPSSKKFGQRSPKVKEEEEKTEETHRGERYAPNPKVPNTQINPQFQNPGRAHVTSRNVATQEGYQDSGRIQDPQLEGARHPARKEKRMGYVEARNIADPAHLHPDSDGYGDSRVVQRPNVHHMPQSQSRQTKAEDYDVSYDERNEECSKSKSRSISEEDASDDRYPRQSRFSHRIQSPANQEYIDDYIDRPQSADESRSFDSRERSEENHQFKGRERGQVGHQQQYYSREPRERRGNIRESSPRHHEQHSYAQMSRGTGESASEHKNSDSVSKSMSISKSFSEPRKNQKVILYGTQNSKQRRPEVYHPTSSYAEEQPPYEEHRTQQQVNGPVSQHHPPRGNPRGQGPENPRRKALKLHGHYNAAPGHNEPSQYERSPSQAHYSTNNNRDHHAPRHHHKHPVQDQQQPLSQQHYTHSHDQRQHYTPHSDEPRQHHTPSHEPLQHHTHSHEPGQHHHHTHPYDQRQPHAHPHEQRQHYTHSHEQRQSSTHPHEQPQSHIHPQEQLYHDHHPRAQEADHYEDHQVHSDSQNQRQDFVHGQQQNQQYGPPPAPVEHSHENKKQSATPIYQSYDSRNPPSAAAPAAHGRKSPAPSYKRDYVVPANNQYPGKGPTVQARKNVEPTRPSSPPEELDGAYYPAQDSRIRHHISSPSIHSSQHLPGATGEGRPRVSVSFSESTYKDGKVEHRFSPEKPPHFDQFARHPQYFNEPSFDFPKTPISDYFEKPAHEPIVLPQKSYGPSQEFEYTHKAKIQDDKFTSSEYNTNQDSGFGFQSGPQNEHYQHPRDDFAYSQGKAESPEDVLAFLKNHADISDKAKIIVAEPVPGKPGVLVADGKRAMIAGRMRGKSPSYTHLSSDETEYSQQSSDVNKPLPANPGHERNFGITQNERNFGITQNIPGSFAALVNTDPKFLRKLPELMHSSREPSGAVQDSEYHSNSEESVSKEVEGRTNYESNDYKGPSASADLKSYGTGHEIIQDHGDGVSSMMYHIRPKTSHKLSALPQESRTSEKKQKHSVILPKNENSEKLQYAKSATVIKTVKPDNLPDKTDKKTKTSTK